MQAIANNTNEKISDENKSDELSLFPSDNIIFPDESIERPHTRYGYIISGIHFLVPKNIVSEVIQLPNIFDLPNSPSWIEGLINIRGNIIPVMNIDKLLKKQTPEKLINTIIFNSLNNEPSIGIITNELPVSLEVNESKTSTKHYPEQLKEFMSDGFAQNSVDWVEFDPHKLFKKLANKYLD